MVVITRRSLLLEPRLIVGLPLSAALYIVTSPAAISVVAPAAPSEVTAARVVIFPCDPAVTDAAVPLALPVTLPVMSPAKAVAVRIPEFGLYVKPVSVSIP